MTMKDSAGAGEEEDDGVNDVIADVAAGRVTTLTSGAAESTLAPENVISGIAGGDATVGAPIAPRAPMVSASFVPSSGSAFSSVSKAVKKTHQQVQQHLHPSALSSYYSSSTSAPGGGAYYLGWNRLQEQLRNQQVLKLSL